jgi:hypothetical protein
MTRVKEAAEYCKNISDTDIDAVVKRMIENRP